MIITACPMLVSVSANSEENNSEPLKIEVTTDKSSYTAYGIAEITVKVTNTSDETVNNISAEAVFEQLAPVGKNNETFKEVESLQSGESFSFSYKATVNASKVKINFFEKIILWFVRLFNGGYTATSHNIEADTENITEIKFGKYTAENVVKVGYELQIFTDEEIKQMDEVDNAIDNFLDNGQLNNLNESERINAIIDFLLNLSENGTDNMPTSLINPESVFYHEETQMIYFEHSCGVSSGVIVKEHKPYSNMLASNSMNNTVLSSTTSYGNENSINSVLMYGWDKSSDKESSYSDYDNLVKKISQYGVYSTIYNNPTVTDYKTAFLNMDLIFIAEHGFNFFDESEQQTYCCFAAYGDTVSEEKYPFDISRKNIYKVHDATINDAPKRDLYIISPKFFEYYYGNNKLKNSVVVVGSCGGFGNGGKENYSLATALHDVCGSSIVVGFHNTVYIAYSHAITESFSTNMLCGYTASEAIQMSIETHCEDDIKYMYNNYAPSHVEWWTTPDEDKDGLTGKEQVTKKFVDYGAAYPCIFGELNYRIPNTCGTFSATVKNRTTDTPIEGVEVSIYLESDKDKADKNIYTYTTNEYGKIKATLPVGKYIAEFTNGMQKAQTTFTIEKDEDYILQSPIYMEDNYWIICNVTDTQGNALQNVNVSVLNKGTGHEEYNVTANSGLSFTLGIGTYEITVSKDGYQSVTQTLTQPENAINRVLNITLTATSDPDSPTDEPEEPDTEDYGTLTETGSCGGNAFYDFYEETGTLVIRGEGAVREYGSMPWYDFKDKIIQVKITKGISSIKDNSFEYCDNIEKIEVDINNEYFSSDDFGVLFNKNKTTLIRYPVGNRRIYYKIPDSVNTVKEGAFKNGVYLNDIKIPTGITDIDIDTFFGCSSLVSITIPDGVISIGAYAFYRCSRLASITIPDSVTEIGAYAFRDTAYYNDSNNWIDDVLYIDNCVVGAKVSDSKKRCEILSGTRLIAGCAFRDCTASSTIVLPDSVKYVGSSAFAGSDFTEIILGNGLTRIEDIFGTCFVTEINIGDNVTEIYDGVFDDCPLLFKLTVSENNKYYSSDKGVLFDKNKTTLIKYPRLKTNTSYEIPSSIICINDGAFFGSYKLTDVYYTGTKEEWEKISIGSDNAALTNATIHYNS